MRLLLGAVVGAALTIAAPAAAAQESSALTTEETAPPDAPPAAPQPTQPNPAGVAAPSDPGEAANADRTALNLLGELNASSGESRRNENVRITLIDNGVLKELNERMGATATIFSEFQIDERYFGKEFGGSPRKQIHLPRSAASDFHGRLYWGHNNSLFSARSFFQVGDVQPARNNDYGVSVSTALGKKTSLSIDAGQRKLRGQVNGNVLVPAADERTPLTSDPEKLEIINAVLGAYGSELPNRTDINPRALNTNSPQNINNDRATVTLDHEWSDDDRLAVQYNFMLQNVEAFQLVGGQNPDTTTRNHRARLTWTRTWTPATVSDFSAGFDRIGSLLVPDETSLGPFYLFGSILDSIGPSSNIPINRSQNMFRYAGRLRQTRGNHLLTAGFEILRRQVNGFESNNHRETIRFRSDFGRDQITNFLMGIPSDVRLAVGNAHRGFRNWDTQFYVGDSWKVNPKLNVNLGMLYQPVTKATEVNGLTEVPYDCDCNNFAPRFGFAYRLDERWGVIRAASAIHYGEIYPATFMQTRFNPPGNFLLSVVAPDLANPFGDLDLSAIDPNTRSGLFTLDPELSSPYSMQYNFSWELRPVGNWVIELGYVGSRSPKLLHAWFTNRARPVEGIPQTTSTINDRRPDPRFFDVIRVINASRGYYDAAKITLRIPSWNGLSLDASYWWSKAIDLGTDYANTAFQRDARDGRSQSEFDVHGESKAISNFDQPHAALWRINYETPSLDSANPWLRRVFGRWQLSLIILLKSGPPFTLRAGSDGPGVGNVDGVTRDRPNIIDPSILGNSVDDPDKSTQQMPRSAFTFIAPTERADTLGRNSFRKDGVFNINAGLSRRFRLGGDNSLLFRAESLNFLNHPQFAEPGINVSENNFGQITNTLNDGRAFRFTLEISF